MNIYGILARDRLKQTIACSYLVTISKPQESSSFNAFFAGRKQMCQRHARLRFHEFHMQRLKDLIAQGDPLSKLTQADLLRHPTLCEDIFDFYQHIGYDHKKQRYLPQGVGIIALRNGKAPVNQRTHTTALKGFWQFAGGKIEPHELPIEAAQREFKEECGLDLPNERFRLLGSELRTNPYPYIGHAFVVHLAKGEKIYNTEPHKHTEWKWRTTVQISRLKMIPGTTKYLQRALATQPNTKL